MVLSSAIEEWQQCVPITDIYSRAARFVVTIKLEDLLTIEDLARDIRSVSDDLKVKSVELSLQMLHLYQLR